MRKLIVPKIDFTATVSAVTALVLWCIGPIFIKLLTGYLDFWTQNFLRYVFGCLFWMPYLVWSLYRGKFDKQVWKRAVLVAVMNTIMQCFWAAAFYYINPAFGALLSKSAIIWVCIFSILFFPAERPLFGSPLFGAGMLMCIAGVIGVVVLRPDFAVEGTAAGIVIMLFDAFFWGAYTVSARWCFRDVDARQGFAVLSLYTVAGLGVLAVLFGDFSAAAKMGTRGWMYVAVSGVLSISLSHVLYYVSMKRIGATIPSLVLLAQPFGVLLISRIIFGEFLSFYQAVFGTVLLTGAGLAILAQQKVKRVDKQKPPD